ncbi:hypothetical protein FRC11_003282, partial [Ceratobasidium sp. 423]
MMFGASSAVLDAVEGLLSLTRTGKRSNKTKSTHRNNKMHKSPAQFDILSPRRCCAINKWSFAVYSAHYSMACRVISISDNDEQESAVGCSNLTGSQLQGTGWKRGQSKSPAPMQSKWQKTQPTQEQAHGSKSASTKKSKQPIAALSLAEQTTRNAASRLLTMEKCQAAPAKKELAETIERIKESKSPAYKTFELPKLIKPSVKGASVQYHGFVCKTCHKVIQCLVGTMETSALLKHQTWCELRKHQGKLSEYGITGGCGPPSMYDVHQYVVQWVSEDGRPFSIIYDRYLRKLFPIKIVNLLPTCSTIVKDISMVYQMTQNMICMMLVGITSIFHIGLDMYQSPNGIDFLGLVIFYPEVKDN